MRDSYDTPVLAPPSTPMDFNGGFLCQWVYWRPNPGDPDPDMPGLKQKITMFMPVEPEAACLCSSGKPTTPAVACGATGIRSAGTRSGKAIAFLPHSRLSFPE